MSFYFWGIKNAAFLELFIFLNQERCVLIVFYFGGLRMQHSQNFLFF